MLNNNQDREVKDWFKSHNIPEQEWDSILTSLKYDLWELKGKETYAIQRQQLEEISRKAEGLISNLNKISWELYEELNQELDNEFEKLLPQNADTDDNDNFNFDFRSDFEKALDEGLDKEELIFLHNNECEMDLLKVPVNYDANIFNYLSKLISSCNSLRRSKEGSRDKELYEALKLRCESIARDYSFTVRKEQIIKFICSCTGKERDTVKKQMKRQDVLPSEKLTVLAEKTDCFEREIIGLNKKGWGKLLNYKIKNEGKVNQFWIHWELVELYNSKPQEVSYPEFLKKIAQNGIGDILEKYGLNCPLPE